MAVMNRLLSTHHQGMGRVGTAVFHPLISLLGRKECSTIPGLLLNTISTIKTTIPVFPYLIANYLNNGSTFLIDLLRDELQYLISNRSMVSSQPEQCTAVTTTRTSAVDINGNIEFKDVQAVTSKSKSVTTAARTFVGCNKEARRELQILLLETLEVLLLFCGSALSATLREIIEILLGQTMSCMTKGLVLPQFSDRRMHRIDCELIRSDRKLQELVLRVATTEVSSIPSSGIMSGNTSILRKAAECCLLNSVTMTQAAKTLHYLSAVIHPTAVMIPSVTLSDATRTYLLASKEIAEKVRKDTEEIAAASGDNRVERDNFNPVDNDAKEMAVKVDVNASERKAISSKRKVETSKKLPAKKQQKTKTNKSVTLAASVTKAQVGIVAEIKASVSKATLQESDDESIPDIDMSAEPDH